MPKQRTLPDGTVATFPDDASDAEILEFLNAKYPEKPPVAAAAGPNIAANVADWLPLAGGVVGGIAGFASGGPPGAIAGGAFGAAGGEGWRQNIRRTVGASAPTSSLQAARDIAEQAVVGGASEMVGVAAQPALRAGGRFLMNSALKPTVTALRHQPGSLVAAEDRLGQTMLDEGINISRRGLEKVERLVTATNAEITAAIRAAGTQGRVYQQAVADRINAVIGRVSKSVNPQADIKAAEKVRRRWMQHPTYGPRDPVTGQIRRGPLSLPEAQEAKTATYAKLAKSYGEMKGAEIEASKALARGLKEDIASEASRLGLSDVNALNAREGRLLAASEAVAHRLSITGHRDVGGIFWVATHPHLFLLGLMDRSPAIKSMLARGMYAEAAKVARVPQEVLRLALSSLATVDDDEPVRPMASHTQER